MTKENMGDGQGTHLLIQKVRKGWVRNLLWEEKHDNEFETWPILTATVANPNYM